MSRIAVLPKSSIRRLSALLKTEREELFIANTQKATDVDASNVLYTVNREVNAVLSGIIDRLEPLDRLTEPEFRVLCEASVQEAADAARVRGETPLHPQAALKFILDSPLKLLAKVARGQESAPGRGG